MKRYKLVYFDDNENKRQRTIRALDIDDAHGIGLRYMREVYGILIDVYQLKDRN